MAILPNVQNLYNELRQEIDGPSETMTHEDSIEEIRFLRGQADRAAELSLENERLLKSVNVAMEMWIRQRGAPLISQTDSGGFCVLVTDYPSLRNRSVGTFGTKDEAIMATVDYLVSLEDTFLK